MYVSWVDVKACAEGGCARVLGLVGGGVVSISLQPYILHNLHPMHYIDSQMSFQNRTNIQYSKK